MPASSRRPEGREIPCEARRGDLAPVFQGTDQHGRNEYHYNEVQATRRVVELSDRERRQHSGAY